MKFFGNLRSTSEMVQTRFREIFYDFFKFGKFSEVFGIHRKICGQDRNCSETFAEDETEYRIWFWEVLKRTSNKIVERKLWRESRVEYYPLHQILPVEYRRICNGFPCFWLAVFSLAWDKDGYTTTGHKQLGTRLKKPTWGRHSYVGFIQTVNAPPPPPPQRISQRWVQFLKDSFCQHKTKATVQIRAILVLSWANSGYCTIKQQVAKITLFYRIGMQCRIKLEQRS